MQKSKTKKIMFADSRLKYLSSVFQFSAKRAVLLCVTLILILFLSFSLIFANNSTLEYSNGSQSSGVVFDPNTTVSNSGTTMHYGTESYFDKSVPQPDLFVRICHANLEINSSFDFVYSTFTANTTRSVLNLPLLVSEVYYANDSNNVTIPCTLLDVPFASSLGLYPGYITPVMTTSGTRYYINNSMILNPSAPTFDGSYSMNLTVDSPPKSYWFTVPRVYDNSAQRIYNNRSLLLTSLVSSAGNSILETVLRPGQLLNYTGTFSGGERLIINGITVFNVNVFEPCGEIRETGYYLLNKSMFNLNSSCINISDVVDVQLNFAGEILDGDANSVNGSYRESECAMIVRNARNVTIEGIASQEFYNGICIINSSVRIYGNSLVSNLNGMYVTNDSSVYVGQTTFTNHNYETNITNRSIVSMSDNTFTTAQVSGFYSDVWLNDVPVRPTLPVISGYTHIEQFLEVKNNSNVSWAQIAFNYAEPLPNNVQTNQIYVYKYNGTYGNHSSTDNVTNITTYSVGWTAANWTRLFTLVSPQQHWIYNTNETSFSVFAPFGLIVNPPGSNSGGSTGTSGGGGGAGGPGSGGGTGGSSVVTKPTLNFTELVQLKLTIPANVTLMQGEIVNIPFSIENLGNAVAYNINVQADVPRGWKSSVTVVDQVNPGETISSVFSLSVYEKVMPADYYIPVSADLNGEVVVSKILKVSVIPRGNLTRLLITEYNPIIDILPNSQKEITFKAKNIGDYPLENVQILLAPNDCIKEITGSHDFAYGEEKDVTYRFVSGDEGNCQYTLKFVEGDKLVDFVPVTFQIRQLTFIEQTLRLLIIGLIVGVWFTVAIVIAFKKRRPPYQMPPPPNTGITNIGGSFGSYQPPNYNQYYRGN